MSVSEKKKHGVGVFVLAGLSFIPLIGVLPGIICIIIALIGRKSNSKLLGGLGIAGISITVILYGYVLPNLTKNKNFEPLTKRIVTNLIKDIEYFKIQNNRYPKNLEELNKNPKKGKFMMNPQNQTAK